MSKKTTKEQNIELEKWQAKAKAQFREIQSLNERLKEADRGVEQLSRAVDAILITVAQQFGKEAISDKQWELTLPVPSVSETTEHFTLIATLDDITRQYIIRVSRKEEKKGEADGDRKESQIQSPEELGAQE